MKQKLFIFLLAVLTGTGTLFAANGTCGDNLTWDLTNGVLTISGTGDMTNYSSSSPNRAPWYDSFSTSITSVVINSGVTTIGDYAFYNCYELSSVTIGNNVTSIGEYAFNNCKLPSVTIPNSVTSIGNSAFYQCSKLTSVTIPNSVTSIGNSAFFYCISMTSVTIGNSVTSIGRYAFSNCGLSSVTNYATTPQTIDSYVFDFVDISACTLNVPEGSVAAYQAANVWKDFGTIQAIDEEPTPEPQPAAVENVQGGKVQGAKFFRDGQLLIEKNGKIYNALGAEVK